ncbi:MAG TPA: hypothetical protein VGE08_09710 [Steroidobacter sp.]|uniref:hypothetical protein n=1 Tax=Steroidobacter sp. TaxID=1978227 RepID=UPI002EDAB41F
MTNDRYFLPEDDGPAQSDTGQPATPRQWAAMSFDPVPIDAARFGAQWEQARGEVARTTVGLLRFDDKELTQLFMNQPEPLRHAMQVHTSLQRELDYLKTHIEALEMAATRVLCAASRCAEQAPP